MSNIKYILQSEGGHQDIGDIPEEIAAIPINPRLDERLQLRLAKLLLEMHKLQDRQVTSLLFDDRYSEVIIEGYKQHTQTRSYDQQRHKSILLRKGF